jgi:hypothetical protein
LEKAMVFSVALLSVLSQDPSSTDAPSVPHAASSPLPPTASADSDTPWMNPRRLMPAGTTVRRMAATLLSRRLAAILSDHSTSDKGFRREFTAPQRNLEPNACIESVTEAV